uniref:uncharacterized protein LOC494388 isoform X2 n=1 Tax=Ciona intestinalis TaxID=7719 RepID=UPI000EF4A6BD|nr:uncharacterized protein LOC494388 isoform X2 [Ciona intestinalis]|eukprot:XP_026689770.1 uncharacterized protein LOC494388 isoform X2 [Ciona intestinalis]
MINIWTSCYVFLLASVVLAQSNRHRPASCNIDMTSYDGTITFPENPGKYPKNTECTWTFPASGNQVLVFSIEKLDIKNKPNKCDDGLQLPDNTVLCRRPRSLPQCKMFASQSNSVQNCGITIPPDARGTGCTYSTPIRFTSTWPNPKLRFYSNNDKERGTGFRLRYFIINCLAATTTTTTTSTTRTISTTARYTTIQTTETAGAVSYKTTAENMNNVTTATTVTTNQMPITTDVMNITGKGHVLQPGNSQLLVGLITGILSVILILVAVIICWVVLNRRKENTTMDSENNTGVSECPGTVVYATPDDDYALAQDVPPHDVAMYEICSPDGGAGYGTIDNVLYGKNEGDYAVIEDGNENHTTDNTLPEMVVNQLYTSV